MLYCFLVCCQGSILVLRTVGSVQVAFSCEPRPNCPLAGRDAFPALRPGTGVRGSLGAQLSTGDHASTYCNRQPRSSCILL